MFDGMMIGSDCADWWEKRRKDYHAELEEYVLNNPSQFAVYVAAAKATGVDFAHTMIVDLARLGEGAAEGSIKGVVKDILRAMTFVPQGKILKGSKTILGSVVQRISNLAIWRHIRGGLCAPISIAQAVQRAGYRIGISLAEVAEKIGRPLNVIAESGTPPALIRGALTQFNLVFREIDDAARAGLGSFNALKQMVARESGPVLVGLRTTAGEGHRVLVGKTSTGIKIIDRYGMFDSLEALSRHYGRAATPFMINTASPMFAIANAVIDPSLMRLVNRSGVMAVLVRQSLAVFDLNHGKVKSVEELDADFERFLRERGKTGKLRMPELEIRGGITVEVTRGDPSRSTLSGIAKAQYGSFELWPLIYDLNKDKIGRNPNQLKAGTKLLVLPLETYSSAEITDARRRAPSWRKYL